MPLAITYPHFLNADPSILEPFEGLNPDKERFTSTLMLQPVSSHLYFYSLNFS